MRNFKYLSLALAALALGACTSDDVVDNGSDGGNMFNSDGTGYINLSINLPTQSGNTGTRANDVTDDGDEKEYKVKDATLILFKGTDANVNAATFAAAYDLTSDINWDGDYDDDQITTQGSTVKQISAISKLDGEKSYALVVLNKNSVFTVDGNSIKFGGTAFSGTFADFTKQTVTSADAFKTIGFFMTNAVVSNKAGISANTNMAGAKGTILTDVDDKIYPSISAAQSSPAADVFVERAVAKVEMTNTDSDKKLDNGVGTVSGDGATTASGQQLGYTITGWTLANKNTSSYIVRNWNQNVSGITTYGDAWLPLKSTGSTTELTKNPYRFAGYNLIKTDAPTNSDPASDYYRTYFGIDPNYNTDCAFTDDNNPSFSQLSEKLYCLENTFDVEHQNVKNTTCAIIKAKLTLPEGWGDDFYTVNGDRSTIYDQKNADNAVLKEATERFGQAILTAAEEEAEGTTGSPSATATAVTYTGTSGKLTIASVTFTITGLTGVESKTLDQEQLEDLNSAIYITKYTNAESYYTVLIKHFGDDLTPWNEANKTDNPYPGDGSSADNNWLGRYGVLRNNWYEIEVTGIKGIGSATVPDVNDDPTPDDNVEKYISVKINMLSWAKRKQSVTLE